MAFSLSDWLMGKSTSEEGEDLQAVRTALESAKEQMTAMKAEKEAAENRANELEQGSNALQSAVGELETKLSSAMARITELEEKPAALHSGGATEQIANIGERAYQQNPIYQQFKNRKAA